MAKAPREQIRIFNTLPNAFLCAVGAALVLMGLRFLAGRFDHLIFWRLIFTQDIGAAWVGVGILVAACLGARIGWPSAAHGCLETIAAFVDRHIAALSLASFPFYAAFAFGVARGRAFAADEASVLFQSQVFAAGRLTAQVPPDLIDWLVPVNSQGHFLHVAHAQGTLVSSFWPGYALLLAPFSLLGVPWACNPFLTSLSLWALHRLARHISGSPVAALWALLFTLASPVIALGAASYFSMPAHLLFNAGFALLLLRQTPRAALWAGVLGAFALLLHNPVPHATFALPWLVWLARSRRDLLWRVALGYALLGLPLLGSWSLYLNAFDASRHVIAYEARGASPGPFLEILARLRVAFAPPSLTIWIARLAGICKMAVWAVPGLLIFAWGGAKIARGPLSNRLSQDRWLGSRLLLASLGSTFIFYFFVRFDQGAGWGFRYLHSAWSALPIAAGIFLWQKPPPSVGVSVPRFAAGCAILSALVLLPFQAWQVHGFLNRQFGQIPLSTAPASLVFIDTRSGDYPDSLIVNDAFLRDSNWHLVHRSDAADETLARRVLIAPRLEKRGKWGQIWVGEGFRPRYSRSK